MEVKAFDDELPYLSFHENGVLYHCDRNGNTQVVIPRNLVSRVLRMMHNDLGHLGFRKTLQRTKERYYWPQMSSEIEDWCKKCEECQRRRNPVPSQRAPLQSITTCRPGELVTMDIVEYAQSSRGYRYCLVMVDPFTKWLELFPLRNQKAESIARKVLDSTTWCTRTTASRPREESNSRNYSRSLLLLGNLEHTDNTFPPTIGRSVRKQHSNRQQHVSQSRGRGSTELGPVCVVHMLRVQHSSP